MMKGKYHILWLSSLQELGQKVLLEPQEPYKWPIYRIQNRDTSLE